MISSLAIPHLADIGVTVPRPHDYHHHKLDLGRVVQSNAPPGGDRAHRNTGAPAPRREPGSEVGGLQLKTYSAFRPRRGIGLAPGTGSRVTRLLHRHSALAH